MPLPKAKQLISLETICREAAANEDQVMADALPKLALRHVHRPAEAYTPPAFGDGWVTQSDQSALYPNGLTPYDFKEPKPVEQTSRRLSAVPDIAEIEDAFAFKDAA